jgi:hypothetical protein
MSTINNKYIVFDSDIKHKNLKNINPELAIWYNENVKEKYLNNEIDPILYRIEESKKNNYYYFDLSYLKLNSLPNLSNNNDLKKVKILFINDNNFSSINEIFSFFEQLEIIDITNNNLISVENMPSSLIEFVCVNNKIKSLCGNNNLKRLNCSNNQIEYLDNYENIEKIICSNNKIFNINTYKNLKYLNADLNPIVNINIQHKLLELDCSNTSLSGKICNNLLFPSLRYFNCTNTNICEIQSGINLIDIKISNTMIKQLDYMKKLKFLSFSDENIKLDKRYNIFEYYFDEETKNNKIEFKII